MLRNDLLPNAAYTSAEWFEIEQRHIFSATWAYAGLQEDLSEPGQYKTVQAGNNNLIILMGQDGELKGFHNMCRHKGTRLLQGCGEVKKHITCPYHDWTYSTGGNLLGMPKQKQEFPQLDKDCFGLLRCSVGIWRGMIWVHPDENAPSLDQWFADIEPYLGPHQVDALVESEDDIVVETIQANWKIVVENYIDHYHLAQLHKGSLNMYQHGKAEFGFVGPHFAFWEPHEEEYAANLAKHSSMPLIDHIPDELQGAYVPMLFPGIGLAESESSWSVFHLTPLSATSTRVEIRTKVMPVSSWQFAKSGMRSAGFWQKRLGPKYAHMDPSLPLGSGDFMQEDIYVCEQQQKAYFSDYFQPGPSAGEGERPVRDHQAIIRQYLQSVAGHFFDK